jgi:spore coat protein U-like protein
VQKTGGKNICSVVQSFIRAAHHAIIAIVCLLMLPLTLQAACTVSATGINFGAYNPLDTAPVDSTGTITVDCTANTSVRLSIGASPTSGSFNPRQIRQGVGSDLLNYNLYTTSARTAIWGNETQGTSVVWQNVKRRTPWNAVVYGRIPSGQNVYTDQYGESLVVQIDY